MLLKSKSLRLFGCLLLLLFYNTSFCQNDVLQENLKFELEQGSVRTYLNLIEKSHEVILSYSSNNLDLDRVVSIDSDVQTLEQLLRVLLEGQELSILLRGEKILIALKDQDEETLPRKRRLSGYIYDAISNEVLIGASVFDLKTGYGTASNHQGYFSFEIDESIDNLVVSYVGFQTLTIPVRKSNAPIRVYLVPNPPIEEVVVTIEPQDRDFGDTKLSLNILSQKDEDVPGFLGTEDPIQKLKLLTGVHSGNEAQGGLYVRGGGTEHNLILMDGVPIYEINHAFSLSSIFNQDAINDASFYKNYIPSKYGGRLSSVVDIELKEGDKKQNHFGWNFGLLGFGAFIEGPIKENKSSYLLSYRSSWVNLYLDPLLRKYTDFENADLNYYDLNAKLSFNIDATSKLNISMYRGFDNLLFENLDSNNGEIPFEFSNTNSLKWRNQIYNVRYSKVLSNKLFAQFSLSHSDYLYTPRSTYSYDTSMPEDDFVLDVLSQSNISDVNAKLDFNYYFKNFSQFNFGVMTSRHRFLPFIRQSSVVLPDDLEIIVDNENERVVNEYGVYIENKFSLSKKLQLHSGIHAAIFNVNEISYNNLQPRVGLYYFPKNGHQVFASFNRNYQFLHLLSNPGVGLPTDLWVPTTENIPPEESTNFSLGWEYDNSDNLKAGLVLYWNNFDNILEYRTPVDLFFTIINDENSIPIFSDNSDWESRVEIGTGTSRGIEVNLNQKISKFEYNLAYTLSKTTRQFDNLNRGEEFPYRYDRTHDLSITGTYKFSENWNLSTRFIYGTGNTFTIALDEIMAIDGLPVLNFEDRNNFRVPAYHRLDISANHMTKLGKLDLNVNFGVQNVYNRNNPFYIYLFQNANSDEVKLKQISIFPILPYINFKFYL